MTMSSFAAKKAQLQREMDKLTKEMEQLEAKSRQPAIESILRTMQEFDITPDEVARAYSRGRRGRKGAGRRAVVQPKYRHPETNATWTGRGRTPLWLVAEEEAGRHRDEFLIEKEKPKPETQGTTPAQELELPPPTLALPDDVQNNG